MKSKSVVDNIRWLVVFTFSILGGGCLFFLTYLIGRGILPTSELSALPVCFAIAVAMYFVFQQIDNLLDRATGTEGFDL